MPLTVCRCCGGRMEPEEHRLNPNVCPSCERLLEDDSPRLMADMARMSEKNEDPLMDQPGHTPNFTPKPKIREELKRSGKG